MSLETRVNKAVKRMKIMLNEDISAEDNVNDALKQAYILQYDYIKAYLGVSDEVPHELEFVIINTALARYNQRGSEGYRSEQVDIITKDYSADLLKPYLNILDKFIDDDSGSYWKFM